MDGSAMKKKHITLGEFGSNCAVDKSAVFIKVGAQEQGGIKSTTIQVLPVRPGDQSDTAITGVFLTKRQPDTDQVRFVEQPVADILMPQCSLLNPGCLVMMQL